MELIDIYRIEEFDSLLNSIELDIDIIKQLKHHDCTVQICDELYREFPEVLIQYPRLILYVLPSESMESLIRYTIENDINCNEILYYLGYSNRKKLRETDDEDIIEKLKDYNISLIRNPYFSESDIEFLNRRDEYYNSYINAYFY